MLSARRRCRMLHRTTDIKAAGAEVEIVTRSVLNRRMPTGVYVGHGHIIDRNLNSSPQFDVVLADTFGAPVLFRAQDGTEYFPFESVYAIGEIKSRYTNSDLSEFVKKLRLLDGSLSREQTSTNFISTGRGRGFSIVGHSSSDKRPYKNPLFSFMLFLNSDGLNPQKIFDQFHTSGVDLRHLPSLMCFLDRGILCMLQFETTKGDEPRIQMRAVHDLPLFAHLYQEPGTFSDWAWLVSDQPDFVSGNALAWLYIQLLGHVRNSTLMPPDIAEYGKKLLLDPDKMHWKPLLDGETGGCNAGPRRILFRRLIHYLAAHAPHIDDRLLAARNNRFMSERTWAAGQRWSAPSAALEPNLFNECSLKQVSNSANASTESDASTSGSNFANK
jgi:hypothetical protein